MCKNKLKTQHPAPSQAVWRLGTQRVSGRANTCKRLTAKHQQQAAEEQQQQDGQEEGATSQRQRLGKGQGHWQRQRQQQSRRPSQQTTAAKPINQNVKMMAFEVLSS